MNTACGTLSKWHWSRQTWITRESQVCECLRRSMWPETRSNQTSPSHSNWSRTGYVTQARPIRNLLFEAKEGGLIFWVMKKLPKLIFSTCWKKPICSPREWGQEECPGCSHPWSQTRPPTTDIGVHPSDPRSGKDFLFIGAAVLRWHIQLPTSLEAT